eukprot:CAMPEP_0119553800 /NCGR_PEP_ID=MMETSP1352-20130426/6456_1 /TAXON_ID=265584 /ORGANISM="Stauroneis constricta, Strain CCMP1120" /LENGTH=452 /DNA_ID=CAMNT_0007600279 /DNA_START=119 /DNA_END=1477 /DNA_ORIENTATION=+
MRLQQAAFLVAALVTLSLAPAARAGEASRRTSEEFPHGRSMIVNGQDVQPGRYPYYVRLDFNGNFGCGGSLIHREFVLTAAHCAPSDRERASMSVVIGALTTEDTTEFTPTIKKVIPHPAYSDWSTTNDIALLQIEPVPEALEEAILDVNGKRELLELGDSVTVIGLGTIFTNGPAADFLQEVELKIVADDDCDEQYRGFLHRKSMVCASDLNQDSCQGDSGGPLMVLGETPADDLQVGVVSFGEECASAVTAGVYADTAYLKPWLDSVICEFETVKADPEAKCPIVVDDTVDPIRIETGETCRDFAGAFYTDWWHRFRRCDWMREKDMTSLYCKKDHEAWVQCPFSCHACTYEEDDDIVLQEQTGNGTTSTLQRYDEQSTPVPMIAVFVLTLIVCCQLCYCAKTQFCPDAGLCCCCNCCGGGGSNSRDVQEAGYVPGTSAGEQGPGEAKAY